MRASKRSYLVFGAALGVEPFSATSSNVHSRGISTPGEFFWAFLCERMQVEHGRFASLKQRVCDPS